MGKLLEWCLPRHKFKIFGYECSLNPGRVSLSPCFISLMSGEPDAFLKFNMKEHMLITVMANVTFGGGGGRVFLSGIREVR